MLLKNTPMLVNDPQPVVGVELDDQRLVGG